MELRFVIPHFKDEEKVSDLIPRLDAALASVGAFEIRTNKRWGVETFRLPSEAAFGVLLETLKTIHPECVAWSYKKLDAYSVRYGWK